MNILKVAFQIFLLYLLYQFIFNFIIPIYRKAKLVNAKMKQMQQQMQEQMRREQEAYQQHTAQQTKSSSNSSNVGEYIDYEEIK